MEPSLINGFMNGIPEVRLVCTGSEFRCENKPIHALEDIPQGLIEYMNGLLVEELIVLTLDTSLRPINFCIVGRGTQRSCQFSMMELLRHCLITGQCNNVIILHNHTSLHGEDGATTPLPSDDDRRVCFKINDALKIVGISMVDFGIVGPNKSLYSFAKEKVAPFVYDVQKVSQ